MFESMGVINLWTYIIGVIFITLVPGPNSLFVLTSSAKHGVKEGYKSAFGVFLGDATLIFLAFLGVASLVRTSPLFFSVVKYAGAAYLLYLGGSILYSTLIGRNNREERAASVGLSKANCFRKALLLSVTNPKMIIFYVSFFVQFVDPAYPGTAMPFFILGAILETFSMIYLSVLIFSGATLAAMLKQRYSLARLSHGCIGTLFLAFGLKLALTTS
ncbi:leucine efflux protein [Leminorella grimontii]|uniref:Leucine efflux protein n=1 Tax=Leminorella grimontii TaxID=82981 RepID=A0AAV5MWF6_9GAMM|nr:leucine efflux protein LeuE [Leminorella grimontii]KFC95640.1 putative transport protein [Leminorella grimontii ATCC 33999 = DSM 5078]GKX54180.1 leucine efflux protein [Leminorella grimontii]VFS59841.1 Leucine efflux protein [Leminorella grimontii]